MSHTRYLHSLATGLAAVALAIGLALAPHRAAAVVVNFDDLVLGSTVVSEPGNLYAGQGITFTSGSVPASLNGGGAIAIGDVFTLSGLINGFVAINNSNAISNPNFAGARNLGLQDTLMSFSAPITSLSLHSDDSPGDGNDLIRLLALQATGNPDEYRVLAFVDASDGAISEPGNLLAVSVPTGFSFGLFQVTTEQEGFDDVTFSFVPEPATWPLLVAAALSFALLRRTRQVS